MENNISIVEYVGKLLESGFSKDQIKDQLLAVGWSESESDQAYSKALIKSGVPVPSEAMQSTFAKKSSAMEIVLNLFSFVLLGVVATSLGVLFYQIINKYFPDPLVTSYYRSRVSTDAIHYATAALIIAFPIYYFSIRLWFKGFQQDEGKVETKLTKWLTYLVMFVTSITIVGDLITTLYTLLEGELSVRFALKALTIFAIAGAVFGFYFLERRKIQHRKLVSRNVFRLFGICVSFVVLFGIILGFVAGGSPATERKRGFDNQRENDLRDIASCIQRYAKEFKRLPNSIEEMKNSSFSYCVNKKDPESETPYEYRVITASKRVGTNREAEYELCATFSLASDDEIVDQKFAYNNRDNQWERHQAGRECDKVVVVIENLN